MKKTSKKNIYFKKIALATLCLGLGFSTVACDVKSSSKSDTKKQKEIVYDDIRTPNLINQQQAILKFTTAESAGSILSVDLSKSEGKYIYTVDAATKKGINQVLTIDAKTGNIIKKEDKGNIAREKILNSIDFSPVMDVTDALKKVFASIEDKSFDEAISYKLYYINKTNIYKFTLGNGNTKDDKPVTTEVYLNAVTGETMSKDSATKVNNSDTKGTQTPSTNNQNQTTTDSSSTTKTGSSPNSNQ